MNDTANSPVSSLGTYVTGSSWIVTYYNQILGADNEAAPYDPERQAPYQQYRQILQLELMVQTSLQHAQEQQSAIFDVTGTAICYGFMVPNNGDVFIANIDNGRQAYIGVTNVEKITFLKASNYLITYKVLNYLNDTVVADLQKKSTQTFQFVKSLMVQGQYPLLSVDQYALFGGLQTLFMDLSSMYFRDFFSSERQTLLVPDQAFETYDHFLTRGIVDIVSTGEDFALPRIRMPAVEGNKAMTNVTVWDALIRTNRTYLITGIQRAGLVYSVIFRNWANLSGIYYTGIDQVVFPKDPRTDVDVPYDCIPAEQINKYVNDGKLRYASLERVLRDIDLGFFDAACQCVEGPPGSIGTLPDIVPVTQDDYYVFTQGFYGVRGANLASKLEVLARGAIDNAVVDRQQLTNLAVKAFNWPNLERFYYIPVILALIRISLLSS